MARMPNRTDLDTAIGVATSLASAQIKAIQALPGAITAVTEAANNINATANEARAVIARAKSVTDRLEGMLDHVEPAVAELTPTLQALKEAQQRIVAMTGSTDKVAAFVEDAGAGLSRLAGLSGASGLFNRIAAATKTEPGVRPLTAVPEPIAAVLPGETPAEDVLAELLGADDEPLDLDDDPEIHDAELADPEPTDAGSDNRADAELADAELADADLADAELDEATLADVALANAELAEAGQAEADAVPELSDAAVDAALHPVELGSEADGPDVADATG